MLSSCILTSICIQSILLQNSLRNYALWFTFLVPLLALEAQRQHPSTSWKHTFWNVFGNYKQSFMLSHWELGICLPWNILIQRQRLLCLWSSPWCLEICGWIIGVKENKRRETGRRKWRNDIFSALKSSCHGANFFAQTISILSPTSPLLCVC